MCVHEGVCMSMYVCVCGVCVYACVSVSSMYVV